MGNAGEVAQVHGLPRLEWRSWRTPFVFFTGKGGVGKTTVAGTTAVALADAGRRVLLVSTDPASNLDDLLGTAVGPEPHVVPGVPGLEAMNLDPDAAASAYRERVIGPYRGVVPSEELRDIEEQLAGECTVEVAMADPSLSRTRGVRQRWNRSTPQPPALHGRGRPGLPFPWVGGSHQPVSLTIHAPRLEGWLCPKPPHAEWSSSASAAPSP